MHGFVALIGQRLGMREGRNWSDSAAATREGVAMVLKRGSQHLARLASLSTGYPAGVVACAGSIVAWVAAAAPRTGSARHGVHEAPRG